MDRINEWINNAPGRRIDVDGSYGLQCLSPDAKVIMSNNSIKAVGNLIPGDKVKSTRGGVNTVISNKIATMPTYEVVTDYGKFRASTEHLFEVLTTGNNYTFKEAKYIREGDVLSYITIDKNGNMQKGVSIVRSRSQETVEREVSVLELDGDKTYIADNHGHHNCKDVIDDYCLWLFNDWVNTIRPANAREAFANSNEEYFEKIVNNPNDPNLIPQRGDIIIWGAMSGNPYGHIAVVAGADTNGVDVIEQDGFLQVPARLYRRPYVLAGGAVIGWLRPRPEKIIGYTPEPISGTARKTSSTVNARDDSNTSSNIFQEIDPNQVVDMKGYVTDGESVNGDTVWYVTARSGKYMSRQLFEDKDLHDLPDLTPKDNIQGYQRKAVESGVRARKAPNTSSDVAQIINGNTIIDMKAWCRGESIENNDVWFVSKENELYLWSGAFTDTSTHDLPELVISTSDSEKGQEKDYSKQIIDISNYQNEKVVDIFPKVGGVIVKTGWVGEKFGGNEFKLDPRAKLFTDKAREAGKLLGFYWLPYFSNEEEATKNAEYFAKCIETLGNKDGELLFVDLEPDFEGTSEQLKLFKNLVLQKTGKQVFTYAGESITKKLGLDRVDWYPNYGTKDNYAHGSLIHQYTESGNIPGYDGKLDLNTTNKSIEELRNLSKSTNNSVNEKSEDNSSSIKQDNKQGEEKMAVPVYTKEDVKAIEEMNRQAVDLAKDVSESDEVKEIVQGIGKRTKLAVYFIGDGLIGLGIIIPQLAVALQVGTLQTVSAWSGVCAAAGAFILTMFGIYKGGRQ